ncbi:MAG: hypothetical protein ACU0DI_08865 [Paracoccaceae bacterium]
MADEDPREETRDTEKDQQEATDQDKEVEDDKDKDKKPYRYSDWASI